MSKIDYKLIINTKVRSITNNKLPVPNNSVLNF